MKIFVLLSRYPYPLEKGDKLRAFYQIKELAKSHELVLCALNDVSISDKDLDMLRPFCSSIHVLNLSMPRISMNLLSALFRGIPFQVGYFYSSALQEEINKLIEREKPDHIYAQLIRTSEYVKNVKDIPKTLDYMDAFSKDRERRISKSCLLMRPFHYYEYKSLLKYERNCFKHFDNHTIISEPDRDLIDHPENKRIEVIRNGVDFNYFKPVSREKKYDIVFIGNMQYVPNINAVLYLADKVLPLLRKHKPDVKFLVAGATPDRKITALQSKNIEVTGWVDDIRECYAASRVFVAPMQIGVGLQNKLLEAMAMQVPCISSPRANEALGATPGKDILIGNNPEEYVGHILHLLENAAGAEELALNAYKFVQENYNWEVLTDKLNTIITSTRSAI